MPPRLYLLCHGPTRATRRAAFPSDEGLEDAAKVAAGLDARRWPKVDAVLASPARAARETADMLRLPYAVAPPLGEIDYGGWAGRRLVDVAADEPEAVAAWIESPESRPGATGETFAEFQTRIGAWLDGQSARGERVLAVTPASVLRAAVVHVLGAPPRAVRSIDVEPLQMLELGGDGRRWTMRRFGP